MASRLLVAVVLLTLPLAGCFTPGADVERNDIPGTDATGLAPRLFADGFTFGFLDAVVDPTLTLHGELYLPLVDQPLGAAAPEKFPTVLVMSPYFGAGQGGQAPGHPVYNWLVTYLVPRGYAVVLADTAGTGGSSGCWDFMGPNEVRGVAAMIDHIAAQPWSDGGVGMIGKSYDGMTQIMAAATNPAALKTIVPVAPLTHTYAGLMQNGIHYAGGWHLTTTSYHQISATPPTGAQERYPGYAVRTIETPTCIAQNTVLGNDPTGAYNAYHQERDFRPTAASVAPSVFFMQGFLDPAVKPDNMFPYFTDLPGPKKAWIGHWQHDYANATWAGREDMFITLHRWFDHELKGIENGILSEPVFDVQDSLGRWRHESTWPPADAQLLALPIGEAEVGGVTAPLGIGSARVDVPYDGALHIAGIPRVTVSVASDRPGGYLVAKLFADDRLVAQGAINLMFIDGLETPAPLVPAQAVTASFDLYPTDFVVGPDAALTLEFTTSDPAGWYDPDATTAKLTLGGGDSTITLPVVTRGDDAVFLVACGERIKDAVPECFEEGRQDVVLEAAP